ncbi:MAG: plastocyanin/azurin family copper-binding protein [Thermodesulfobacteriota bacterium]
MMKKIYITLLIPILFFFAAAAQAETVEIEIRNFNFYPPDPVIDVGDTVVWTNKMNYGHWVISGVDMRHDNKFFSYLLLKGTKFSYTFRTPGDYPYYCPIHSMQAMISVVGEEPSVEKPAEEGGEAPTRRRRRR